MKAQPCLRIKIKAPGTPLIKAMLRRNKVQTGSVSACLVILLLLNNFLCFLNAAPVTDQCRLGKEKCAALLGDGGWATEYDPGLYTSRCNIPKVDLEAALSADDFRAQFEYQAVRSHQLLVVKVVEAGMASALSFPLEPWAARPTISTHRCP